MYDNKPPVNFSSFYKCRFCTFVVLHMAATLIFLVTGVYVLSREHHNWRHSCEKMYHVKRYLRLCLVFIGVNFGTYCLFSRAGCEQAARARATALTVLHLAFSLWGTLTWKKMDALCADAAGPLLEFSHVAVCLNAAYFVFFVVHELFINPHVDWTVMPAIHLRRTEFVNFMKYTPETGPVVLHQTPSSPPGHTPPQYSTAVAADHHSTNMYDLDQAQREGRPQHPPGLQQAFIPSSAGLSPIDHGAQQAGHNLPRVWDVSPHSPPAATQPRHLASHIDALRHQQSQGWRITQP